MRIHLTEQERGSLEGADGEADALAMRILTRTAEIMGAERLLPIASAHVDGCLYHGRAGLDFAERLVAGGARVRVPTTLNVGSLDLLHPELVRGEPETRDAGRRLMDAYVAMGCRPTWTCAPYQLPGRPGFGEQIAWAESNAIVFANSVLGARTERYGDLIDICCAITGRAPDAGLHRDRERRARVVFRPAGLADELLQEDVFYPVLGHLVGRAAGSLVPAIDGLPPAAVTEDRMKALGAAAASSGAVALVHVVGATPEAPTLEAALQGDPPLREVEVSLAAVRAARDELTTATGSALGAVSLGTPHASLAELEELVQLTEGSRAAVPVYVSTGRDVAAEAERRGLPAALDAFGATIVTDTCTYVTPILEEIDGAVMTDSAKWAWYAPGNLGVLVAFGSRAECVRSAVEGRVVRDPAIWGEG